MSAYDHNEMNADLSIKSVEKDRRPSRMSLNKGTAVRHAWRIKECQAEDLGFL